jgi:hypothetical protein
MAYLLKNNSIFLHVPKTGGSYIKTVLLANNLIVPRFVKKNSYRIGENKHIDLSQALSILTSYQKNILYPFVSLKDNPFIFYFVRHPKGWYESYFKYLVGIDFKKFGQTGNIRQMHPLSPLNELYSKSFNVFMSNILEKEPHFLTKLYFRYSHSRLIGYVGKQENMKEDLQNIISHIYPTIKDRIILPNTLINKSKNITINWEPNLYDRMMDQEKITLTTYNYHY